MRYTGGKGHGMSNQKFPYVLFLSILISATLITSCRKPPADADLPKLTVGMMSAVDAAPFYHALTEGYYRSEGVDVSLVLFTNAQNRQSALQTGQVDGAMTDLVALVTNAAGDFKLTGTLSTDGLFPLLSKHGIPTDGKLSVATMEISVTNYVLDHYLAGRDIDKVFINEIPARLEAVAAAQVDAGVFPEPFASIGTMRGLVKNTYPSIPRESLNIVAFSGKAIATKRSAIEKFHAAYGRAVKDLQANPDLARAALYSSLPNIPEELRESMELPVYRSPRLPSDAFIQEIIHWTAQVTKTSIELTPKYLIDRRFIGAL